jgi:lysophospholipid hydrolase
MSIEPGDQASKTQSELLDQQAAAVLARVESRTAHVREQAQHVMQSFFDPDAIEGAPSADDETRTSPPPGHILMHALEHFAPGWSQLVPDDPELRARFAHLLLEKYGPSYERIASIRRELGLDDETVQQAYMQRYGHAPGQESVSLSTRDDDDFERDTESGFTWVRLPKGEILIREGDPSDAMYVVMWGRLRVVTDTDQGQEQFVTELGKGETTGEMGFLTGDARSATVYAARDSDLLMFSKTELDRLIEKYPRMTLQLARVMARRLDSNTHAIQPGNNVTSIAVIPLTGRAQATEFAHQLAVSLAQHGTTLHLNPVSVMEHMSAGRMQGWDVDADSVNLVGWLNDQEQRSNFVIYEGDATPSAWTIRCLRQADRVVVLGEASADPAINPAMRDLVCGPDDSAAWRELVLLHPDKNRYPAGTGRWLQVWPVRRHHHVCLSSHGDVGRVARFLAGRAVGLVLSGGGSRAAAHIGVIRALREEGIPIDMVGGASGGAIAAAECAAGWDHETMLARTSDFIGSGKRMKDFTLPMVSLLTARHWYHALCAMFDDMRIEDLWLKCFFVSSNLTRAEVVVHQEGHIARALRASTAFPGIVPPVIMEGELLVDGGVLNNVPIDVMNELCENGTVIAVDVGARRDLAMTYHFGDSLSGLQVLWSRINPFATNKVAAPNIVSILLRAQELNSIHTRASRIQGVSLYLNPPVDQFSLLDQDSFEELVNIGYRHAREKIAAWRRT